MKKIKFLRNIIYSILLSVVGIVLFGTIGLSSLYLYYRYRSQQPFGHMQTTIKPGNLGGSVVPFIGTGGYFWVCGNNFPGASAPFGVVRLSPDTESTVFRKRALNTSGYYYPDNRIIGFSHTRLSGTGATDGGNFRVIPATGDNGLEKYLKGDYARFSHQDECAFPGYYAVKLRNPDVLVELTATPRTGIHRYTFTAKTRAHILLDICSVLGEKKAEGGALSVNSQNGKIEGEIKNFGTFSSRYGGLKVYFSARFDSPFSSVSIRNGHNFLDVAEHYSGNNLIADFSFEAMVNPIVLRLGISHVSIENARLNLEAESNCKSFEEIAEACKCLWEEKLSLIQPEFNTEKEKTIFYTALYRSFQMPTLFQDVNGEYTGFDKKVHRAEGFNYYTDLSLWDTFRTLHPLYTLIVPEIQRDMIVSLVKMKEQGGFLPRWPSGTGYTGSMLGSPANMVISESYQKGIRDFDVKSAYEGMKFQALFPTPKGSSFGGRSGISEYNQYGFCPTDLMSKSVSRTLEYAWADYALAILADSLGFKEDALLFYAHAMNYKNIWNPSTRYFQPRNSKGEFSDKFKPLLLSYFDPNGEFTKDYVEGSALQWRFAVPYDSKGLIGLFGGESCFVKELNDFFDHSDPALSSWNPGSYYWHGNEPDIHAAYLFNEAGRPDLTQKWSRWILENKYSVNSDGIDGNDDGATLSSWYIFSSIGLYPIAGTDYYETGSPLFKNVTMMAGKNKLQFVAEDFSQKNRFVDRIFINDQPTLKFRLKHGEIKNGGVIRFKMCTNPQVQKIDLLPQ